MRYAARSYGLILNQLIICGCMTKSLKPLIYVPLPLYGPFGNSEMNYAFRIPDGRLETCS
jgi:hypothetical protein